MFLLSIIVKETFEDLHAISKSPNRLNDIERYCSVKENDIIDPLERYSTLFG